MTRLHLPVLIMALAAAACSPTPAVSPAIPSPTMNAPSTPTGAGVHAPEGWKTYSSDALGFSFAYPQAGALAAGDGNRLATIEFAADPATNVVRELISVSGEAGAATCASPLAEGWAADDLSPETVVVNGISFLRQTHSGVAAGTSMVWAAYTTERDGRCVSLGFELSTFDPENLDPTRFPTTPLEVDREAKVQDFEAVMAMFLWLW